MKVTFQINGVGHEIDAPPMKRLLDASGPQLMDRFSIGRQLDVLNMLLKQTRSYELSAGLDLYRNPDKLMQLVPN